MIEPGNDPVLDVLEDADCLLGVDPQRVAALDPETLVTRWREIRPALLADALPVREARARLYAGASA